MWKKNYITLFEKIWCADLFEYMYAWFLKVASHTQETGKLVLWMYLLKNNQVWQFVKFMILSMFWMCVYNLWRPVLCFSAHPFWKHLFLRYTLQNNDSPLGSFFHDFSFLTSFILSTPFTVLPPLVLLRGQVSVPHFQKRRDQKKNESLGRPKGFLP